MKTLIKISTVVAILFASASFASAQCCGGGGSFNSSSNSYCSKKTATAPHGGILKEAGKYKIEMVKDLLSKIDPVKFYLLDKKGKEVTGKSISGTAVFKFNDNTTETVILESKDDGCITAQLQTRLKPFTCTLTLTVDKKIINVVIIS